jgi:PIN domain nuclease of toxin-antitoxin system
MIVAIADTHTTIWYLFSDPRLGRGASAFIEDAMKKGDHIGVSAITLAEMVYLTEKGRIVSNALRDVYAATESPNAVLRNVAFDDKIARRMAEIPRRDLPDLPDRVIAATALVYKVPVLSRDRRIRTSTIQSLW